MALMNFIRNSLAGIVKTKSDTSITKVGLPIARISAPDDFGQILGGFVNDIYAYTRPKRWPIEIYDIITNMTLQNPDLRQAVGHIVQLGNTGHVLTVAGDNEAIIEAAVKRIQDRADSIFPYGGGPDGLINSLFAQAARTGAVSIEWVPTVKLDGIDKAFLVPVRDIRWVPLPDNMGYYPVQIPKSGFLPTIRQMGTGIKLNPRTYYYANLERLEDSPYAVPPFLAAINPVTLQQEMIRNIHKVIKKAGIMGLMTYKVAPLTRNPGENDARYQARSLAYLTTITDQIKDSFGDGIAAGFQGAFDFDVQSVTGDMRGVADMFKLNEEQLFSAIGADPAMHGRTYSTTETYASVVFSKMISQLENYQRVVGKALDFGWGLDLMLAGITADINVGFKKSEALSNLQEAQSEMIEIANSDALYASGVIDQQEKANRCGYPFPAEAEPRPDPALAGQNPQDKNLDQRGGGAANTGDAKKKQPKEQTSHKLRFTYNLNTRKYEWEGPSQLIVNTLADKSQKSTDDKELAARFARYLHPSQR